jgi:hypothetical protein
MALLLEMKEGIGLHPDKIPLYGRGFHVETGEIPPIVDCFEKSLVVDLQVRPDILCFQGRENGFVEKGDLEEKILFEDLIIDSELLGTQSDGGNSTAFPVSPVVHLNGGFKDVTAAQRYVAGKPRNAAPSLFRIFKSMGRETGP